MPETRRRLLDIDESELELELHSVKLCLREHGFASGSVLQR